MLLTTTVRHVRTTRRALPSRARPYPAPPTQPTASSRRTCAICRAPSSHHRSSRRNFTHEYYLSQTAFHHHPSIHQTPHLSRPPESHYEYPYLPDSNCAISSAKHLQQVHSSSGITPQQPRQIERISKSTSLVTQRPRRSASRPLQQVDRFSKSTASASPPSLAIKRPRRFSKSTASAVPKRKQPLLVERRALQSGASSAGKASSSSRAPRRDTPRRAGRCVCTGSFRGVTRSRALPVCCTGYDD